MLAIPSQSHNKSANWFSLFFIDGVPIVSVNAVTSTVFYQAITSPFVLVSRATQKIVLYRPIITNSTMEN